VRKQVPTGAATWEAAGKLERYDITKKYINRDTAPVRIIS